jgi:hypothetical protein
MVAIAYIAEEWGPCGAAPVIMSAYVVTGNVAANMLGRMLTEQRCNMPVGSCLSGNGRAQLVRCGTALCRSAALASFWSRRVEIIHHPFDAITPRGSTTEWRLPGWISDPVRVHRYVYLRQFSPVASPF